MKTWFSIPYCDFMMSLDNCPYLAIKKNSGCEMGEFVGFKCSYRLEYPVLG